ncbi:hypothetical protein BVJ53_00425 [Lacticaseibacillus chiayiensis]|uniref:PTS sugar transporter n=1 Tax=Lacticaseibacillus chiayiensis TaxID=2100821 RepID=A0A4Q1UHU4_9LACO|nr:PTS sugar transporter [Lacticaseibacillus chiayiensis]RXT30715.1 hypothetical protein BVJ53_00425 [Lacticaseibacillus chiayiensis]UYN56327.1 PTS sugar transporter [Lacticaseibacillus chiayiensis]
MEVILLSHGRFAEEILKSAEMILGNLDNFTALGLQPSEGPDQLAERVKKLIDSSGDPDKLIIVDLLGGTPSNVAISMMAQNPDLRVLSGLNLPMILAIVNQTLLGQKPSNQEIIQAGQQGVLDVREAANNLNANEDDET